ncbi:CoA-transferase [Polymorphospora sp. NPDC051019]|uniref:CoA transferase subunit A n=1 Tax=Polymorphospora sp. NPDC051019 TaxID=3155725 RepID=UPI00343274BD
MPRRVPRMSMRELVADLVPDGQQLLIGGFAFGDPMALAHEIVRQRRTGLDVLKTSGGVLVDLLVGAGCVAELAFCHVWNSVGPEPAHAFRRAVEGGHPNRPAIEELSFGAMTMGLAAGALGLPFMPTTPVTLSGHDLVRRRWPDKLGTVTSPFGDGELVSVARAITPRIGIFHVQRVDEFGNGQVFGPTAELRYAIGACERIVLVAEEVVATEVVRERPELTVVPGFAVEAVVVEPWAAHPTDSSGYYRRDLDHHIDYGAATATVEGFEDYVRDWIDGTDDHPGFLARLGGDRLAALALRDRWW